MKSCSNKMRYAHRESCRAPVDSHALTASGEIRAQDFSCLRCCEGVSFVSESCDGKSSHFRHGKGASCTVGATTQDIDNIYENGMSVFHRTWQGLFDGTCREVRVGNHRTDVLLDADPTIHLATFGGKRRWALEIQHSSISAEDVTSRQTTLDSEDRGLIWIVDASACKRYIERVLSRDTDTTRMSFPNMQPPAVSHLMHAARIMSPPTTIRLVLDIGCDVLWVADMSSPAGQALTVEPIEREEFIRQLRCATRGSDLVVGAWPESDRSRCPPVDVVDYRPMQDELSRDAASDVEIVIEVMETVPFHLVNSQFTWQDIGHTMRAVTGGQKEAYDAWSAWVSRRWRKSFRERMTFGPHKGTMVCNLPEGYISWLLRTCGDQNCHDDNGGHQVMSSLREVSNMRSDGYRDTVWRGNKNKFSCSTDSTAYRLWRLVRVYADSMSPLGVEPAAVHRCATARPAFDGCPGDGSCMEQMHDKTKYIAVGACAHSCIKVKCLRCGHSKPARLVHEASCCSACAALVAAASADDERRKLAAEARADESRLAAERDRRERSAKESSIAVSVARAGAEASRISLDRAVSRSRETETQAALWGVAEMYALDGSVSSGAKVSIKAFFDGIGDEHKASFLDVFGRSGWCFESVSRVTSFRNRTCV